MRRLLTLVALVAAVLVSALLVGGARSANNASGLIAFSRGDGIYVMRPDGTGARAIRRQGVALGASRPAWSPDGSKLAFARGFEPADPDRGIWVMSAAGGDVVHLLKGRATSPTWSADGQRIAFILYSDVWIMNANGSNRRRLTKTVESEDWVDWSPVADRIAFSTFDFYQPLRTVYVMDARGRNMRKLTTGIEPDWSPDGRRIAFAAQTDTGQFDISVIDANGRSRLRLTHGGGSSPAWSPDGRRIAFVRGNAWLQDLTEIHAVNSDGTGETQLTHNRVWDGYPAWQPVATNPG